MNIVYSFRSPLLASAAVTLALTAGAFAQEVTISHPQGETTINGVPEKVFVIDWAAYDNLVALGVEVDGAPGSNAPSYLGEIPADLVPVGSLFEPDFEGIAAEQPDLVIVAARSASGYPTLAEIAPTIDLSVSNAAGIVDGVKHNLTTLGEIFGVEAKADELIAALDEKVAAARELAQDGGVGLVIVTNAGNLGIYGPDSRVAWVYNELGVASVFDEVDDRDHGGDAISFEYLLETNPDWLFVVDRDAGVGDEGAARALLDNELIHQTTFWQNDHLIFLDPQAAYISMHGYSGLMLMLDQVIEGYTAN